MDSEITAHKLESLRRCLQRIRQKCPISIDELTNNYDTQDILTLNLSRAIQLCVDIGTHLIADTDLPVPNTMGETFAILAQENIISQETAKHLQQAVGFRNLIIHNYTAINWNIVHNLAQYRLIDFENFAKMVITYKNLDTEI